MPQPAYPSARAGAPALTADEDDMVRTDGDLTKLLLPLPKGSKLADDIQGWESLSEYAQSFDRPGDAFRHQLELGFRRAAHTSWRTGDVFVNVELSQYQHAAEDSADSYVSDQLGFAADRGGDPGGSAIPGYPSGRAYAGKKAQHADDGSVFYESQALAYHGDIVVDVFVVSPRPISAQTGIGIIESQLERL
ncbi:hypothetical protein [Streptacidiphilus monticola]|uniref:hypothetical protein n=1 Tax=Streptacidiphilus monticola TaxID=2161674 RepID=UPI0036D2E32B